MGGECFTYRDNENAYGDLVEKFDVKKPFGRPGLKY
jgi:hypothetical protein